MSLINDALKRAQEAQGQIPLPISRGPQLRPVDPPPEVRRTPGRLVPLALALLGIVVLFLAWQGLQHRESRSKLTDASSPDLLVQAKSRPPAPAPAIAKAVAPISSPRPEPMTAGGPRASQGQDPAAPEAPVTVSATASPAPANTNAVVAAAPLPTAPPAPAPLKLQGILYHPSHPSVVVSGKTLFVGDRIREFQVKAIKPSSATLSGPDGMIVLTLP